MRFSNAIVFSLVSVFVCDSAYGQSSRYELGLRVKRFERLFEKSVSDEAVRAKVLPSLEAAVTDFFTMRHARASERLDKATALLAENEKCAELLPLSLILETRLLDKASRQLSFVVKPVYRDFPNPKLRVSVALLSADGQPARRVEFPLEDGKAAFKFDALPEGDYEIVCTAKLGVPIRQNVSVVYDVDARLEAVAKKVKQIESGGASPLARCLKYRTTAIRQLQKGRTPETDVPVYELLTELESWAAAGRVKLAEGFAGKSSKPPSRMVLTARRKSLPCRLSFSRKALKTDQPLVIALHGAGGSENMFYEAYGAGKVVRLAQERDWTIVCPKISLFGLALTTREMIESLKSIGLRVDEQNVFVVGHSMGAGTTIQLAGQPTPLRAIAVLGGGAQAKLSEENKGLKSFIAAGDRDFGRAGAGMLAKGLKDAGASVEFRTYKNTEHLGIVQVALDDVFKFFDSYLVGRK